MTSLASHTHGGAAGTTVRTGKARVRLQAWWALSASGTVAPTGSWGPGAAVPTAVHPGDWEHHFTAFVRGRGSGGPEEFAHLPRADQRVAEQDVDLRLGAGEAGYRKLQHPTSGRRG